MPTVDVVKHLARAHPERRSTVTLRYDSRLLHIGVGRAHTGTRVILLVADLDVRIVSEDGELLRQLTIDPGRDYQPIGST